MKPLVFAISAGAGAYFLYTAIVFRNRSLISFSKLQSSSSAHHIDDWLAQAGLAGVDKRRIGSTVGALFIAGFFLGWSIFGGFLAPAIIATFAASFPVGAYRQRRNKRRAEAAEAWPRMIDEIRLRCGSLGQPIPQALLDVGKHGPGELRPAFVEAEREWLLSTDFARTVAVLKTQLADPTADTTCETLLVAHSVGGSDIEQRLTALVADRRADVHGRKDARAKQSGVRFARRFVLIVPAGMALVGMSIGNGRDAYATTNGQLGVTFGLITLVTCWWWAGRLIRLPEEQRVFRG